MQPKYLYISFYARIPELSYRFYITNNYNLIVYLDIPENIHTKHEHYAV